MLRRNRFTVTLVILLALGMGLLPAPALADTLLGVKAWLQEEPGTITIIKDADPADGTDFDFAIDYFLTWGSAGTGDGQFQSPYGVAVDGSGNVYVADRYNHRIQKFDSDGAYLTQWGSHGAGDGQFQYPYGVAVDGSGNVYVADTYSHRIQKFDSDGAYLAQWGSKGADDGQFQYPWGVAVDGSGNVYVADRDNHRIQKFDSNGAYLAQWGSEGTGDGQFQYPLGVAVDGSGNVYVADYLNYRIQKFSYGFTLDDEPTQTDSVVDTRTFSDLPSGSYLVEEERDSFSGQPWALASVTCIDQDNNATSYTPQYNADRNTDSVTIDLQLGQELVCTFINIEEEPTAVTLLSFTAQANSDSVALAWETGTEVDNAGFNLYRASAPGGPWTKVNGALIAAQGDPVSGASYSFVDEDLAPGTYTYKLEDVDLNGVATLHGPVSATAMPRLRRPPYRPTLP